VNATARQGVLMLLAAACLVVAYVRSVMALPTGTPEFVYGPFGAPPPFGPMFGFTLEQAVRHLGWVLLLGPAWAIAVLGAARLRDSGHAFRWPVLVPDARHVRMAVALGCLLVAGMLFGILRGHPITDDENVVAWQARLLSSGRLADADVPPIPYVFFTVHSELGWATKYLPGSAVLQIPGVWLGYPALLHVPLFGVTVLAFFVAVRREAGERVAAAASILLALSPMAIATSATGLSHAGELACIVGAGLGLVLCRSELPRERVRGGILAAACLGFGMFVRPQTVVPFGVALGLGVLWNLGRRHPRALAAPLAIGVLALGVLAWINHALTGSVLRLPWSLTPLPERWGFGQPFGTTLPLVHDPLRLVQNVCVLAVRLNQWAFGSPVSLGVIAAWWWAGRPTGALRTWVPGTLAAVAFMAGWYSPGVSDTGAVYWYVTLPALALLGGHAWSAAVDRAPRLLAVLVPLHLLGCTVPFLAEQSARLYRLVDEIHAPFDAIVEAAPRPLLVLYELRPSEVRTRGWVGTSIPRIRFDAQDAYFGLRPDPTYVDEVMRYAGKRTCLYVRAHPVTNVLESRRCEDAQELIRRPFTRYPGPWIPSTAIEFGLDRVTWH
jgi:hypothetical protein